jgi:hypothetical protein
VFSSGKLEACDLRFSSIPFHRSERSSRPRHHRNVLALLSHGAANGSAYATVAELKRNESA